MYIMCLYQCKINYLDIFVFTGTFLWSISRNLFFFKHRTDIHTYETQFGQIANIPLLYNVGLQATFKNMNFTVWAVWEARATMKISLILLKYPTFEGVLNKRTLLYL